MSNISRARLRPIARDNGTIGVEKKRPILTPGVAKRACSAATQVVRGNELTAGRGSHSLDFGDHRLG
ncbi:hypothetical protein AWC32_10910 [Mycobacterium xenopi]|nr:hypothetical protein AWC32_10910 [Mycobacterium xenopi]